MQFYLFAPAIIGVIGLMANRAPRIKRNYIRLICLAPLTLASFVAQHFLVTDPAMAFAGLHSRLWQFTLGMMSFFGAELFKKEENLAATHLNVPIEGKSLGKKILDNRYNFKAKNNTINLD
jgi:peptidoglycan/LPS O-acetylase OafA/YrhL